MLAVAELVSSGIASFLLRPHFGRLSSRTISATVYVPMALVLLILSRFGLAMPAVILDDYRIAKAMFLSDELTKGKWPILAVLLFKSLVGAYIAGVAPFWLARWTLAGVSLPSWFPWLLTAVSMAAVTLVEPIMFIGFALLYLKTYTIRSTPSQAHAVAV
jgi:hypothetical protein